MKILLIFIVLAPIIIVSMILAINSANKNKKVAKKVESDYVSKESVLTAIEKQYMAYIKEMLPSEYKLLVQQSLYNFIAKVGKESWQRAPELNRIVDFLIVTHEYKPIGVIEINDSTHRRPDRQARDEKVKNICNKAELPILMLDTADKDEARIKTELKAFFRVIHN